MKRVMTGFLIGALVLAAVAPVMGAPGQEGAAGEVVLDWPTIWVPPDSKSETIAALIERFNVDNEGAVRVQLEGIPDYDGYADKMNTQLASGSAPDLFIFSPNPTTFQYYESDVLMDFTEELSGPWSENFVAGYIEASTRDGRTKTVPYEIGLTPIWYNSAHLAQVGYDEFPKTMDEFWELAEALKAADVVPTSQMTGGGNAWTSMLWFSHIVGSLGGPDVWSRPLSDPVFEEAAAVLMRLYQDGNTTRDAVGGDAGVSGGHYMAGNTAVFLNGPWYIGRIRNDAPDTYAATKVAAAPQVGDYHGHQIGFMLSNLAAANTDDPRRRAARGQVDAVHDRPRQRPLRQRVGGIDVLDQVRAHRCGGSAAARVRAGQQRRVFRHPASYGRLPGTGGRHVQAGARGDGARRGYAGRVRSDAHRRQQPVARREFMQWDDPRPQSAAGRFCLWKAGSTVALR